MEGMGSSHAFNKYVRSKEIGQLFAASIFE